jgi:3-(3-hydroxy-phenyl)propionate hydroxylase
VPPHPAHPEIDTALDADVAVIGLGPVGATVTALLAAHGVRTLALERAPAPSPLPRAVALDDEALRILQAVKLGPTGSPELLVGPGVALRGRGERLLLALPPAPSYYGHPTLAFVHQPDLEASLRRRLAGDPLVQMRLGVEVTALLEGPDAVTLRLSGADRVRVRYVVGCDGAGGVTRRALGVALRGWSSPRRWLVIDGRPSPPAGQPGPFTFHADPRRPRVDGPLPGGRHRWEFMLAHHEDAAAMLDPARTAALLRAAGIGVEVTVERAAVYTFHSRVAARWRRGRVLLLGDAAHLSPPFAGQGLGAGLRDADNVAWKLAAVVCAGAPGAVLHSYPKERRAHVRHMNAVALGLGGAVQTRAEPLAALRDALVTGLARVPPLLRWARRGGWKPVSRHRHGLVARDRGQATDRLHGCLMPQPQVLDAGGRSALLDDALGPGFALVGLEVAVAVPPAPDGLALHGLCLRRRGAAVAPGEVQEVDQALRDWWPLAGHRVLILRPDRFVFAVTDPDGVPAAMAELWKALGLDGGGPQVHGADWTGAARVLGRRPVRGAITTLFASAGGRLRGQLARREDQRWPSA